MAETRGLVQHLALEPSTSGGSQASVSIGPSPTDVRVFFLLRNSSVDAADALALKSSMIDALAQAMAARREVVIVHDTSFIQGIRLDGG